MVFSPAALGGTPVVVASRNARQATASETVTCGAGETADGGGDGRGGAEAAQPANSRAATAAAMMRMSL